MDRFDEYPHLDPIGRAVERGDDRRLEAQQFLAAGNARHATVCALLAISAELEAQRLEAAATRRAIHVLTSEGD